MTNEQFARSLKVGLFADRDTVAEALDYAHTVLKGNPEGITALHVVLNTVADQIVLNSLKEQLGIAQFD